VNPWVLAAIAAFLIGLRFLKPHALLWVAAWWGACLVLLKFGVVPPMPSSIVGLYMAIVTAALLLYLSADSGRLVSAGQALVRLLTERKRLPWLLALVAAVPLVAGFNAWREASRVAEPPASGRTIHPAPPQSVSFKGKDIDLVKGTNPYRELEGKDPAAFDAHVANGRKVYYRNCVFCHGDNMEGDGLFAHGFDPLPANFQDPTTIAMLQETYLFWRIAKGGPGLPEESTPWSSAMPAWEKYLSEEDIWDVILFLYRFTGQKPRAAEAHE
jgi:mono/diheme cytochrome c family protein